MDSCWTVLHWNMCMPNAVAMVTELGKHSMDKVGVFAQMQTSRRGFFFLKIDIVNPDRFVFTQNPPGWGSADAATPSSKESCSRDFDRCMT